MQNFFICSYIFHSSYNSVILTCCVCFKCCRAQSIPFPILFSPLSLIFLLRSSGAISRFSVYICSNLTYFLSCWFNGYKMWYSIISTKRIWFQLATRVLSHSLTIWACCLQLGDQLLLKRNLSGL